MSNAKSNRWVLVRPAQVQYLGASYLNRAEVIATIWGTEADYGDACRIWGSKIVIKKLPKDAYHAQADELFNAQLAEGEQQP